MDASILQVLRSLHPPVHSSLFTDLNTIQREMNTKQYVSVVSLGFFLCLVPYSFPILSLSLPPSLPSPSPCLPPSLSLSTRQSSFAHDVSEAVQRCLHDHTPDSPVYKAALTMDSAVAQVTNICTVMETDVHVHIVKSHKMLKGCMDGSNLEFLYATNLCFAA